MSGGHFHVHGPHDHVIEHAGKGEHDSHGDSGENDGFASRIAVTTAILSTLGAIFGYQAGHTQNAALLYKNDAAIQKTAASNQWNFYQAKSNKQNLAELSVVLTKGDERKKYEQEIDRYKQEKKEIKVEADKLEIAAREAEKMSDLEMKVHGRWALATTLISIAIALSAIALLTRKKWLMFGVYGASAIGVGLAVMGAMHV